mgnify:CR=1 FL=1
MNNKFTERLSINNRSFIPKKPEEEVINNKAPKHGKGEFFLCGPIPWDWLSMAAQKCGKGSALQVALALWFLSGLNNRSATVKLTSKTLKTLGVQRNSGYRGLQTLEKYGLISVVRKQGASPLVTLLDIRTNKTR